MQSQLNIYLSFRDNAREVLEFYKSVFGGKLEITLLANTTLPKIPPSRKKSCTV